MKNDLHTVTLTKSELDQLFRVLENDVKQNRSDSKRTKNLLEEIKLQTVWSKSYA
jgi:hypothetical protein